MVSYSRQTCLMFDVWYCLNVTLSPLSDIVKCTWEKYCQTAKKRYVFKSWRDLLLIGIHERKKSFLTGRKRMPIIVKSSWETCLCIFNESTMKLKIIWFYQINIFKYLNTLSKFSSKTQDVFWKYKFLFKNLNDFFLIHLSLYLIKIRFIYWLYQVSTWQKQIV